MLGEKMNTQYVFKIIYLKKKTSRRLHRLDGVILKHSRQLSGCPLCLLPIAGTIRTSAGALLGISRWTHVRFVVEIGEEQKHKKVLREANKGQCLRVGAFGEYDRMQKVYDQNCELDLRWSNSEQKIQL